MAVAVLYISPSTQHQHYKPCQSLSCTSLHLPSIASLCLVHLSVYSAFAAQCRTSLHLLIIRGSNHASLCLELSYSSPPTEHRWCKPVNASLSPSTQHPWYQSLVLSHISPSTQHPRPVPVSCPVAHFSVYPTAAVPVCLVAHSLSIYPTSVVPICLVARSPVYPASVVPPSPVSALYTSTPHPLCEPGHFLPPSSARLIANRHMSALSRLVLTQST